MAKVRLFDGTVDLKNGLALEGALKELAHYQKVEVSPYPGKIDIPSYNFVKELERTAYNSQRKQVDLDIFFERFREINPNRDSSSQNIILLEEDIFRPNLNWCFGQSGIENGQNYVIISNYRITRNGLSLKDWICHELGHMYGAAKKGRSNTTESLGSHCTNDLCVMQQKLSISEAINYANERRAKNAPTYCPQCQNDLKSVFKILKYK